MSWSNTNSEEEERGLQIKEISTTSTTICPSCGLTIKLQDKSTSSGIQDLPGLPAGVKFDPSDQEILQHLEAKLQSHSHPLIDEFIPTIQGQNGICYTHPQKLPGVSKDGQIRHFFHRPSKAYTTGTRKRRKVHSDATTDGGGGGETRWHKTGKTRPISAAANIKGYKKILVLYTNYGRQRKPEKTNWVMHQYHLGENEEEKDGELVLSKVFYQTQPRQCGSSASVKEASMESSRNPFLNSDYYTAPMLISYNVDSDGPTPVIPNLVAHGDRSSSFIRLPSSASKGK